MMNMIMTCCVQPPRGWQSAIKKQSPVQFMTNSCGHKAVISGWQQGWPMSQGANMCVMMLWNKKRREKNTAVQHPANKNMTLGLVECRIREAPHRYEYLIASLA